MNVSLSLLRRLKLNDQVYIWDVKSSRSDVCCHKHMELGVFEALQSDLSLSLRDVTMHHFNIVLDLVREE